MNLNFGSRVRMCYYKSSRFACVRIGINNTQPHLKFCTDREKEKKEFQWRVPWSQREGEWYSAFGLFAPQKGNSPDLIKFLQTPIDLRPSKVRRWWQRKKLEKEIYDQRFIEERHEILGSDLAAAHFIVHRGGSVKFLGIDKWIVKDSDDEYDLPPNHVPELVVECLDLSNMDIHYEGFENLTNLQKLTWLSVSGCPNIDDWCIDRISGEYCSTLEYLDLSNCHQVTYRSLSAMYRLSKLKTLKLNNIVKCKQFEFACLLLEDINPNLAIEGVNYINTLEPIQIKKENGNV